MPETSSSARRGPEAEALGGFGGKKNQEVSPAGQVHAGLLLLPNICWRPRETFKQSCLN